MSIDLDGAVTIPFAEHICSTPSFVGQDIFGYSAAALLKDGAGNPYILCRYEDATSCTAEAIIAGRCTHPYRVTGWLGKQDAAALAYCGRQGYEVVWMEAGQSVCALTNRKCPVRDYWEGRCDEEGIRQLPIDTCPSGAVAEGLYYRYLVGSGGTPDYYRLCYFDRAPGYGHGLRCTLEAIEAGRCPRAPDGSLFGAYIPPFLDQAEAFCLEQGYRVQFDPTGTSLCRISSGEECPTGEYLNGRCDERIIERAPRRSGVTPLNTYPSGNENR